MLARLSESRARPHRLHTRWAIPRAVVEADPLLVQGMMKQYDGTWAVQGLDLRVGPGEIVGLIGPNGAGKTTTLKSIVGLLQPDGGRIAVNGVEVARDAVAYRAALGYMPEAFTLPDYLSGEEFLEYVGRLHDLP